MKLYLEGRHALITGGSRGIGAGVARALASEGCHVHLAARESEHLTRAVLSVQADYPAIQVQSYPCDLSHPDEQDRLAQACGFVDILINNAGAIPDGDLAHAPIEAWRAAWELKVFGYINLARRLFLQMRARRSGVIANVIGVAGDRLRAGYIMGSTGNAALMAFTRALGGRSVDDGVRVVGVNPSLTATERGHGILESISRRLYDTPDRTAEVQEALPFGRMVSVEEIADAVTFLVSPRASYISGVVLNVDGGHASRND